MTTPRALPPPHHLPRRGSLPPRRTSPRSAARHRTPVPTDEASRGGGAGPTAAGRPSSLRSGRSDEHGSGAAEAAA